LEAGESDFRFGCEPEGVVGPRVRVTTVVNGKML
jgi:hypothetical protein